MQREHHKCASKQDRGTTSRQREWSLITIAQDCKNRNQEMTVFHLSERPASREISDRVIPYFVGLAYQSGELHLT